MQKKLLGLTVFLGLLAGCAGTQAADRATVTLQVPTTVFVTTSVTAAAPSSLVATSFTAVTTSTADDPASSKPPPVGSKVPFVWSSFEGDNEGVATLNTATWTTEADEIGGKPKNGAYLILDVSIQATKGSISVNPLYWQAKDSEGRTYKSGFTQGKEPSLSSGELPAGQRSRGFVELDTPKVPVTVQLVNPGDEAVAAWSVPAK